MLAAKIALASLDYAEVLRLLKGVHSSEAAGLRGRALWYKGELEAAADELDAMLNDPEVKDDWAKSISKLARRGAGRTPFVLSGGMLASLEMVHVSPVAPYFIIPIEIDGESALAMLATGSAEVVLDSATRPEPSWVSLRLGQRLEVHDVPALAQDLSGVSKEVGAPIKALPRRQLAPSPQQHHRLRRPAVRGALVRAAAAPSATRLNLHYVRGGGMVVRGTLGGERALAPRSSSTRRARSRSRSTPRAGRRPAPRWIPSSSSPAIRSRSSAKASSPAAPRRLRHPRVLGISGVPVADLEKVMGVDLDGVMGSGLLYQFRCTFGDDGRVLWIEDDAEMMRMMSQPSPEAPTNSREAARRPRSRPRPAPCRRPTLLRRRSKRGERCAT